MVLKTTLIESGRKGGLSNKSLIYVNCDADNLLVHIASGIRDPSTIWKILYEALAEYNIFKILYEPSGEYNISKIVRHTVISSRVWSAILAILYKEGVCHLLYGFYRCFGEN